MIMQENNKNQIDYSPIRVLHAVGGMTQGGTETWLMNVLRHIDRNRFRMDFLVHTNQPCIYDEEIRRLGGRIIPCLNPSKPLQYAASFNQVIQQYGPYDVIHSHMHYFSGYLLRLAHQAGIPIRIAHSHCALSEVNATWNRRLYLALSKLWIDHYATFGLGCSEQAAAELYGLNWKTHPCRQVLYCGTVLSPFQASVNSSAVRAELGIPSDAFVVGHVGRFAIEKNHSFLVEVATETIQRNPKTLFLLIGQGALHSTIQQQVVDRGLEKQFIFAGSRSDVPRLMMGAMDAFIFPSLFEGLGLALIEAQAAGLPCLFSDVIPTEVDAVYPLIHRFSLSKSPSEWAERLLQLKGTHPAISPAEALACIANSPHNFERTLQQLESFYQTQYAQTVLEYLEKQPLVLNT
ncbi:MAG TPA: glycosyltransferase family 1 protein [Coleofasciculaceae cyanobacterium]